MNRHPFHDVGCALLVFAAARLPAAGLSFTNTIARMSDAISTQMAAQGVQGLSIALVHGQSVPWATGFGLADRERGVAADADTIYHIGSCSKALLGAALMRLRDQDRVDLEAPLTRYIPEFSIRPRFPASPPLTVRSLLNHHSGLPGDFFNGMITRRLLDDREYVQGILACLRQDDPFAPVNQRASYCNTGFLLASDVVRRIAGAPFHAAMDTLLLGPLGMASSSFRPDHPAVVQRLAAAYDGGGAWRPPEYLNAQGSGSMYSSVNDLTRFIRMVLAHGRIGGQSLISSNALDLMDTPQLTNLPLNVEDLPQGLGWDNVSDYRLRYAGKVSWKDGAPWFHCGYLADSRDPQLGVAILQNSPGNWCDELGIETLRWAIRDATGAHWPTNAYVPDPAPVTTRPQAELDALAGLYIGNAGYHRLEVRPGSLTLVANAHLDEPVVFSNLVPRVNGWFSAPDSQARQFAFANLAGHPMLVMHRASGAFAETQPLGERFVPAPLSPAWQARVGRTYRLINMHPHEYFWEPGQPEVKTLQFAVRDRMLLAGWMLGVFAVDPQSDTLAFQPGTHYRKGGAMRVSRLHGFECLEYSSYRFLDEAAIPDLPPNIRVAGAIPFPNGTQWYWLHGRSGMVYRLHAAAAPRRDLLTRLAGPDSLTLATATNGPLTWTCPSNGIYAAAISATGMGPFAIVFTADGLHADARDVDGDRKADPAVFDGSAARWQAALSAAGYAIQAAGLGAPGALDAAADYDGDRKTDPAVCEPASGQITVLLSARGYAPAVLPTACPGAQPAPGDFDGDLKADPAVCETGTGHLTAWLSGNGYRPIQVPGPWSAQPAVHDYDGDGRSDPAWYESAGGQWWQVLPSGSRYAPVAAAIPGGAGGRAAPADYDGDGKADPMVFQPDAGAWIGLLSTRGYAAAGMTGFGGPGDVPLPADYDGDGIADPAVYAPATRAFRALLSGSGYQPAGLTL